MAPKASHYVATLSILLGTLAAAGLANLPTSGTSNEKASPPSGPGAPVLAVAGHITQAKSRWVAKSKLIVTDVTLAVERASRPGLSGEITFVVPGGELVERNMRMTINAIPIFRSGQQVVVSLDAPDVSISTHSHYRYRTHLPNGAMTQ